MQRSRFQLAFDEFHRRLPALLAQGDYGRWVLFHAEELVEISDSRDRLYQIAQAKQWPDEDVFIDLIAPELQEVEGELFDPR